MKPVHVLKSIAILVCFIFTATTISWSAPLAYKITVPEEAGKVTQRYKGDAESDKLIIHVQDAHSNFDAQKNLAYTICALLPQLETQSIPFVGIEGAIGEYDLKELRDFPIEEAKERVGEKYVKEGKFVGAELASIIAKQDFTLYGLEDKKLFTENFKAFYQVALKQADIEKEVIRIEGYLEELKKAIYNEALTQFDNEASLYEQNASELLSFLPTLYKSIEDANIDLLSYVSLLQFKDVLIQQQSIDFDQVQDDIETLAQELIKNSSISETLKRYYVAYKNKEISQAILVKFISNTAKGSKLDLSSYDTFNKAAKYWQAYGMTDMGKVMRDILIVNNEIRKTLSKTDDERVLIDTWARVVRLKQLLALKALKEDVKAFQEDQSSFSLESIVASIKKIVLRTGLNLAVDEPKDDFNAILQLVDVFYQAADKRDKVMLDNLLTKMEEKKQHIGVLVAGGYHSEGLVNLMQERTIPYITIMPQIADVSESIGYMNRMMGNVAPLDPALISHLQISRLQATGQAIYEDYPEIIHGALAAAEVAALLKDGKLLQDPTVYNKIIAELNKQAEEGSAKAKFYAAIYDQILNKGLVQKAYVKVQQTTDNEKKLNVNEHMPQALVDTLKELISTEKDIQEEMLIPWRESLEEMFVPQDDINASIDTSRLSQMLEDELFSVGVKERAMLMAYIIRFLEETICTAIYDKTEIEISIRECPVSNERLKRIFENVVGKSTDRVAFHMKGEVLQVKYSSDAKVEERQGARRIRNILLFKKTLRDIKKAFEVEQVNLSVLYVMNQQKTLENNYLIVENASKISTMIASHLLRIFPGLSSRANAFVPAIQKLVVALEENHIVGSEYKFLLERGEAISLFIELANKDDEEKVVLKISVKYAYNDGEKTTGMFTVQFDKHTLDTTIVESRTNPQFTIYTLVAELLKAETIDQVMEWILLYYPEMWWLTDDVDASPIVAELSPEQQTFVSQRLFGEKKHIEFDRTATSIMALLWVIRNDYETFTVNQNESIKLSRQNFEHLRSFTLGILGVSEDDAGVEINAEDIAPERFEALLAYLTLFDTIHSYLVTNDLGKIKFIQDLVQEKTGLKTVEHDFVLAALLNDMPNAAPSFRRLQAQYQEAIRLGVKAGFNMGQFIQAENIPASLAGLIGLDKQAYDLYQLHLVYDIAGVLGHINQNGAMLLHNPLYENYKRGLAALKGLTAENPDVEDVYDSYLEAKAQDMGTTINIHDESERKKNRALVRIAIMVAVTGNEQFQTIKNVFEMLNPAVQAILIKELNIAGVTDGYGILPYYGPHMLNNTIKALKAQEGEDTYEEALSIGLNALARIFQEARIALKGQEGNGVFTAYFKDVADYAAKAPKDLPFIKIELDIYKDSDGLVREGKVVLFEENDTKKENPKRPSQIDPSKFEQMAALSELEGDVIIPIGIGGGSDVIQAAMLGKLLHAQEKKIPAVISVRTAKTGSQGKTGQVGEQRSVNNHGEEIVAGVYQILPETTGTGRFLENLPATDFPVFLVIDEQDGTLSEKIQAVIDHVGGSDTVLAVDTGGDALYSTTGQDMAKATPDQDIRVLNALSMLKLNVMTAEVATGVDTPDNAEDVLLDAAARYYNLNATEREQVLEIYRAWEMDGTNPDRFGKTPFSWQAALNGKRGFHSIPLPLRAVLSKVNTWNPFVNIGDSTEGIFFMRLDAHLAAITVDAEEMGSFLSRNLRQEWGERTIAAIQKAREQALPNHEPLHELRKKAKVVTDKSTKPVLVVDADLESKYLIQQIADGQGVDVRFSNNIGDIPDNADVFAVGKKEMDVKNLKVYTLLEIGENATLEELAISNFHLTLLVLFAKVKDFVDEPIKVELEDVAVAFPEWRVVINNAEFHSAFKDMIAAGKRQELVLTAA